MRKLCLVVTAALLATACASQIMSEYIGKDIRQAAVKYGPPTNFFDMGDGVRAFQWRINKNTVVPGYSRSNTYGSLNVSGNNAYLSSSTNTYSSPGYVGSRQCNYTLFGEKNKKGDWIVTGFEKPSLTCE